MSYTRLIVILLGTSLTLGILFASLSMLGIVMPILSEWAVYVMVVTPIPAMVAVLLMALKMINDLAEYLKE